MVNHCLQHDGKALVNLLKQVEERRKLNQLFAQYIEPKHAAHYQVANLENDKLIVIVDSGSWATQLRFHIPDLLAKLRQQPGLENLKAICCKTRPDRGAIVPRKKAVVKKMESLSVKTAELVLKTARGIKDKKLKGILEKIARRKAASSP